MRQKRSRSTATRVPQGLRSRLSTTCSAATLGKTAGKDAAQNKATFVTLLGVAEARVRARALHDEAVAALTPFGGAAQRLGELVDWIALRTS